MRSPSIYMEYINFLTHLLLFAFKEKYVKEISVVTLTTENQFCLVCSLNNEVKTVTRLLTINSGQTEIHEFLVT